ARRGAARVTATDLNPRAVACARENMRRLGLEQRVSVMEADLFPPGRADLIVCNPPWLPGAPTSALELGIYDEGSGMLRGFLAGLGDHLAPDGEAWLVLSDLAEHLGLRPRGKLLQLIDRAGLEVVGKLATAARHPRAKDDRDPLHAARSQEVTTLWRLRPAAGARPAAARGRRASACGAGGLRSAACGLRPAPSYLPRRQRDPPAGQHHVHLAVREPVGQRHLAAPDRGRDRCAAPQ